MRMTTAASMLCAAALLIGCTATQEQTEVSPGALDGSKASCQTAAACSPATCSKTTCPSAAQKADEQASPGAVSDVSAGKSCCPKSKEAAAKQCPSEAAQQCPSKKTTVDETVSPGAFGGHKCCPPCPKCPKCPAHPNGCPPCPPGCC